MTLNSTDLYLMFLLLIYIERLVELIVSRHNIRLAMACGAREYGRGHFVAMALFHAVFPVCCGLEVVIFLRPFPGLLGWLALAVAIFAQLLRWWVVKTLGKYWSVRIIIWPDMQHVTAGPFRYVRHPNYLAVVLEVLAVPLIHGAWLSALIGSAVNAVLLTVRIRAEEKALGPIHEAVFTGRPRLVPGGQRGHD